MNFAGKMYIGYAARNYSSVELIGIEHIELNIPELLPETPRDDKSTTVSLGSGIVKNTNFPKVSGITSKHSITINYHHFHKVWPDGSIKKDDRFLVLSPTGLTDDMMAFVY